ncbi:MAG: hypothetical protein ACRDTQ_04580 [Micromonosporaceae bacterium]
MGPSPVEPPATPPRRHSTAHLLRHYVLSQRWSATSMTLSLLLSIGLAVYASDPAQT